MKLKGSIFWGYLDSDGRIYVKKYINDRIIENYERLPFVKGIFDPFYASNIQQAAALIKERYIKELH